MVNVCITGYNRKTLFKIQQLIPGFESFKPMIVHGCNVIEDDVNI